MDQEFDRKLAFCLFLCKLAVVLLLVAWSFDKVFRPEHSMGVIKEFYHIPITSGLTVALGLFHFLIAGLYLFGLFKRFVTTYVLAIVSMPLLSPHIWDGMGNAITKEPHPTILFFTIGCVMAAAFTVWRLRDYDRWLSFGARVSDDEANSFTQAKDELLISLFFCRVAVFIVFCVWIYSKLAWPARGAGRMKSFWLIDGFPEWGVIAFSYFELMAVLLFVFGLFKRPTRALFMGLALLSFATPRAMGGFIRVFEQQAWHTILHFPAFSLFACAVTLYVLRDYDTLFSLNKADKGKQ